MESGRAVFLLQKIDQVRAENIAKLREGGFQLVPVPATM